MKQENLFYSFYSGLRSSFSIVFATTDTYLAYLTDQIRIQMDRGYYTGMVMIDLQKAIDSKNKKIKALGVDPLAIKWF